MVWMKLIQHPILSRIRTQHEDADAHRRPHKPYGLVVSVLQFMLSPQGRRQLGEEVARLGRLVADEGVLKCAQRVEEEGSRKEEQCEALLD